MSRLDRPGVRRGAGADPHGMVDASRPRVSFRRALLECLFIVVAVIGFAALFLGWGGLFIGLRR